MTSINDIADFARIIREQPEWADAIRSVLLGQELLTLPNRFADLVTLTEQNFRLVNERLSHLEGKVDALEGRFDGLESRFDRLEGKVDALEGKVDNLDNKINVSVNRLNGRMDNIAGTIYENKVEKNLRSLVGRQLNLRRIRIHKGSIFVELTHDMEEILEAAEESGLISSKEYDDILSLDLIFTGKARGEDLLRWVATEISITVGNNDIERAVRRSRLLSRIINQPVLPTVIGANIDETRNALAQANDVAVMLLPEEWSVEAF